jgi:hypothetical protein
MLVKLRHFSELNRWVTIWGDSGNFMSLYQCLSPEQSTLKAFSNEIALIIHLFEVTADLREI